MFSSDAQNAQRFRSWDPSFWPFRLGSFLSAGAAAAAATRCAPIGVAVSR